MTLKMVKTQRDEAAEHVIGVLEDMLQLARETPQASVMVQMIARDGAHKVQFSSSALSEQVGLIELAKFNMMNLTTGD